MARYRVGIDLGTTHTLVAYAPAADPAAPVQVLGIEQLVAPGEVAARALLPSLRYHPAPGELPAGDTTLPWSVNPGPALPDGVVGEWAGGLGARVPGRLVSSAKSWLSHTGVDRTAPILPWGGVEGVPRISPVQASAAYLAHVRAAWNHRFPDAPLEYQDVVLTLPASFDEGARMLTLEAARLAGLVRLRLLEEPQAACYDWVAGQGEALAARLGETRLLLVCDVGGGTTDLTLIRVRPGEGGPRLTRIGVGDHLMLGGDNMDLALAHLAERRLTGAESSLGPGPLSQLVAQCRRAKESLLAVDAPPQATVTVLGAGARVVGGSRSTTLEREEVRGLVEEGFFPDVPADARPQGRRAGIVEFGLPYAADPAVTRHLAAFLARHAHAAGEALGEAGAAPVPDAVLLNGGVFRSETLAARLVAQLERWRGAPVRVLNNPDPDRAVARGAVAYGRAEAGQGVRIGGGSARSYFLVVEGDDGRQRGVCLLPRGTEEGTEQRLRERRFALRVGQPVRFHLVSSTDDAMPGAGEVVDIDYETFRALPPIATVLDGEPGSRELPVELVTGLTELGTLEVGCETVQTPHRRWRLEFQLRGATTEASPPTPTHPRLAQALERIGRVYGARARDVAPREVKGLRADLERILGKRESWDMDLLRALFDALWEGVRRRRRSADHERLWFSLAGYTLRPGTGHPLDAWRARQLWSLHEQGVQHVREAQLWSEWWTLWRRVAGGLEAGAQERLLETVVSHLEEAPDAGAPRRRGGTGRRPDHDDLVKLLGALEAVAAARKVTVGDALVQRLESGAEPGSSWWAVGRLGARVPLHASAHNCVPPEVARRWLQAALAADWDATRSAAFAAAMLARVSGDRARDLDPVLRGEVARALARTGAPETWQRMVSERTELDEADARRFLGDSLPPGLRLVH